MNLKWKCVYLLQNVHVFFKFLILFLSSSSVDPPLLFGCGSALFPRNLNCVRAKATEVPVQQRIQSFDGKVLHISQISYFQTVSFKSRSHGGSLSFSPVKICIRNCSKNSYSLCNMFLLL